MSVGFWISYGLLWVCVALSTLVIIGMLRTVYAVRAEDESPVDVASEAGTRAPAVAGTDLAGRPYSSGGWETRTALLFVSPDCLSCKVTLPELSALHKKVRGSLIVICRSAAGRCAQMAEQYDLDVRVIADDADAIAGAFGVTMSPTAVLIAAGGVVEAFGSPLNADDLERLIVRRRQEAQREPGMIDVITPA